MTKKQQMQRLTKADAHSLLTHMKHQRDAELSSRTCVDAYVLEDGKILLVSSDWEDEEDATKVGALWESRAALLSSRTGTEYTGPSHILVERLPQGRGFANAVPGLIEELALSLQLPLSFFDYSRQSVYDLDRCIRARLDPGDRIRPPLFGGVVAYIGEVIRRETGGRWDMRHIKDGNTDVWEPWVVTPSGREYAPFATVFKELYDRSDESGHLVGAIPSGGN